MRDSDLIPNRDFLITPAFWLAQGELGRIPLGLSPAENRSVNEKLRTSEEQEPLNPKATDKEQSRESDMWENDNVRSKSGTLASSSEDKQLPKDQSRTVLNEKAFTNEIRRTTPDINWDYAVIQRLDQNTLSTRLVPFNLGRALNGGAQNPDNQVLLSGDVITIFSQIDLKVPEQKRTKFVRLEGEFLASGVYEVSQGETLKQLVRRVGGLTPSAYLFGSEFTRESARLIQQARLDEIVSEFELNVERQGSSKSENVLSSEEALALKDRIETQRHLAAKLRELKATGRIVLGIKPAETAAESLPDLVLEDGDRFVVPYRPATVNVVGAVYNDNSFVYEHNRSFNYYLHRAGGGTRNADRRHSIVVRADGSVVSGTQVASWFSGGLESLRLLPGDTIVVPEKIDQTTFLKGLKDWSQVIAQFGLGAAAVITLTR